MAKEFNTSVTCDPERHYMVDTTAKMKVFESMIDKAKYFTINRARQFGKSTSLNWILHNMSQDYLVVPISFETESDVNWQNDGTFFKYFCGKMVRIFTDMDGMTSHTLNIGNRLRHRTLRTSTIFLT